MALGFMRFHNPTTSRLRNLWRCNQLTFPFPETISVHFFARHDRCHESFQLVLCVLHCLLIFFIIWILWEDRSSSPKVSDQQPRSPHATFTPQTTTQAMSWRADAPIILPGWEHHTGASRLTPTIHRALFGGEMWVARHSNSTSQNESKL